MLVNGLSVLLCAALVDAGVPATSAARSAHQSESAEALPWRLPQPPSEQVQQRCDRIYRGCQRLARYQISLIHPWAKDSTLSLTTDGKSTENSIRPDTGTIEGLAFLCRFGPYDEKQVGCSRTELLRTKVIPDDALSDDDARDRSTTDQRRQAMG